MELKSDVFLALAEVVWADGQMKEGEARLLVRAAKAAGIEGAELAAIERATKSAPAPAKKPSKLTIAVPEGEFVYALACLLSASDGEIAESEREAIAALGDRMKLPLEVRARAAAASVQVGRTLDAGVSALDALSRELDGRR